MVKSHQMDELKTSFDGKGLERIAEEGEITTVIKACTRIRFLSKEPIW